MAEEIWSKDQVRDKEGDLQIPLDRLRTYHALSGAVAFTSGELGVLGCVIASGKEAYLRQMLITELSGLAGGRVWLETAASGAHITPRIAVEENTTVALDANEAIGPLTSGIVIMNESCWGEATLIVQIDPKVIE